MTGHEAIMSPIIQYGFAGLCVVLLAMLFWLVKRLLDKDERHVSVIADLSHVIKSVDDRTAEILRRMAG